MLTVGTENANNFFLFHKDLVVMVAEHIVNNYALAIMQLSLLQFYALVANPLLILTCKEYGRRARGWQLNRTNIITLFPSHEKSDQIHQLFHKLVAEFILQFHLLFFV